jgi:thiamine transport system permease protein
VVTATAFQALLGRSGLINQICTDVLGCVSPPIRIDQSIWFVFLAHVFYNTTLVLRMVGGFWANLDPGLVEAARLLGAGRLQTFARITLPLLQPVIWSSALLVFTFCFTSFGIVLILGGPGYATMEVEIYRQAIQLFNLPAAAILSLLQLAVSFAMLWLYSSLSCKSGVTMASAPGHLVDRLPNSTGERLLLYATLLGLFLLLITPLLALVVRSLTTAQGLSLDYYRALLHQGTHSVFYVPPITAVLTSLSYAGLAMLLALVIGTMAAQYLAQSGSRRANLLDALLMTPLAVSAVTLGFGYIVTLNRPPLNLRDSMLLVPLAHSIVAFPFVVRCLLPSLRRIPNHLRQAAAMLGARPFSVWLRIDLPLAGRALLAGAVFAFAISMGEFGASAFVARPQNPTLPVAIFRLLGQPGSLNYGQAMAMSVILMAATGLGFVILERLRTDLGGDF